MNSEEARYKLLRLIDQHPTMSQRQLAEHLGLSLGKTNYCLQALVDKGYIKFGNFTRSADKTGYRYMLTPSGALEKLRQTRRFLRAKRREYVVLSAEIAELSRELKAQQGTALSNGEAN